MRASRAWWIVGLLWLVATDVSAATTLVVGDDEAAQVLRDRLVVPAHQDAAGRAYEVLRSEGWLWARVAVTTRGDTTRVRVDPGRRARVGTLQVRSTDDELARVWREAAALGEGVLLRPSRFEAALRRGLRAVGERGHPFASATVVEQTADPATGRVALTVSLVTGPRRRIGAVVVEGATHTRPDVLARLSGLEVGDWVRESTLEESRARLEGRSHLVRSVEAVGLRPRPGEPDEVDVVLRVEQAPTTGSFSAAIGAVRDDEDETRISGSVDLVLLDLFGTARAFTGRWSDDGRSRRRLDVSYLEPAVFGTGLDLRVEAGQRHEDDGFDLVRGDLRVELPDASGRLLSFSIGADRTTFFGQQGRVRLRQRFGGSVGFAADRPRSRGFYGTFRSAVEAARVVDRLRDPEGDDSVEATIAQTLVEFDGRLASAFGRNVAVALDLHWRSTETGDLPLPRSEQWALGGATTVRGYAEERFLGERVAWGGGEVVLGPADGGQGFLFLDLGWVQTTREDDVDEQWLRGFGVGLRSPTTLGAIDLSLGFAERVGFDAGKLHLVLVRGF
ncbi:MAG TPA: POTRA domain-containing protein [Candidatus Krumholzibacteria bacterium]|nr:POTRA domain-containing protein [Candidatus Krumholzibacteria bacterium]